MYALSQGTIQPQTQNDTTPGSAKYSRKRNTMLASKLHVRRLKGIETLAQPLIRIKQRRYDKETQ